MASTENIFNSIPELNYSEPAIPMDAKAFKQVVESRRSVRVYDGTPIPEKVVRECLGLALLAPNSSNLQPWEFYWVKNPKKKSELVKACLSQPAASTAAEIFVAVARTKTWPHHRQQMLDLLNAQGDKAPKSVIQYYKSLVPLAYSLGPFGIFGLFKKLLVSVAGLFRVVPREPTSTNDLKIWAVKSTALACENLMLALRAYGFDSCPMEGLDSQRVKKILELPSDAIIVMAISAGRRASNGVYGPRIRFDQSQFIKEIN